MQQLGTHIPSLLSMDRLANLIKYSNHAAKGAYIAEFGVYQGGSLEVLAKFNPGIDILAIDSFEGVAKESEHDFHREGDFGGIDYHALAGFFKTMYPAIRFIKGFIPKALEIFDDNTRYSFSHIDLDMYEAVKHTCEFVFPRTITGGIMLFDDYKVKSTPGATKAIDEFFEDKECKFKGELFFYEGGPSHHQYLVVL